MKKLFAILLCAALMLSVVACAPATTNTPTTGTTEPQVTEAEYKLGMGVVVDTASSATGNAQVDATVATVVTDADGKIVVCRIDVAQSKFDLTADFAAESTKNFKTKMELGDDYNMAKYGTSMDWNGDGVVKEWYEQAKAFEAYVVGKTAAEVEAIATKVVEGAGYVIAADDALLSAGCTIQITDFIKAVAAACKDEQGMTFKTAETFTLGVAAATTAAESEAATADKDGTVKLYSDFAATVIANGKILAALNDAIQPNITVNAAGEIVAAEFKGTKRALKEDYNMAKYGASMDWNGDGKVLEWYLQSAEFSKFVVGKTAAEVADMATKVVEGSGYVISADEALLTAGCTIQITGIKAVVAKAATNAR